MIQPGSIVAVKKLDIFYVFKPYIQWLPVQDENTPYVVRDIGKDLTTGIEIANLEEGVIGYYAGYEICVGVDELIELLPPEEVSLESILTQQLEMV